MKAQWRQAAKRKRKHRVQNLQQPQGMILDGNEQEQERLPKAVVITVDVWIWTGNVT